MDFCVLYNQGPGQTVGAVFRTAKIAEASIASPRLSSIVSAGNQPLVLKEWVKGKTLDQALEIKNTDIVEELALPPVKIHCSVLAEDAIKAAISDLKEKSAAQEAV